MTVIHSDLNPTSLTSIAETRTTFVTCELFNAKLSGHSRYCLDVSQVLRMVKMTVVLQ